MFYIIGTSECEYCDMAKGFLFEKCMPYVFYEPETEEELNDLKRHWTHGTVPIVLSEGFDRLQAAYGFLDESSGV